jgi:hypothetical protein
MPEKNQPDWATEQARVRWPRYQITGSGPYTVVCPMTFAIECFDSALSGRVASMMEHSPGCTVLHKRILLHQPQPAAVTRSPGAWERD